MMKLICSIFLFSENNCPVCCLVRTYVQCIKFLDSKCIDLIKVCYLIVILKQAVDCSELLSDEVKKCTICTFVTFFIPLES